MTFGIVATPFNKRRAEARRLSFQRRPGLAGRQPKIEDIACALRWQGKSSRDDVAAGASDMPLMVIAISHDFEKQMLWIVEVLCSSCRALATQREHVDVNVWAGVCDAGTLPLFCPTVNVDSEKEQTPSRDFYCAWGCFSVFVSAPSVADTAMLDLAALTRI